MITIEKEMITMEKQIAIIKDLEIIGKQISDEIEKNKIMKQMILSEEAALDVKLTYNYKAKVDAYDVLKEIIIKGIV
jgi:hypothetical protein